MAQHMASTRSMFGAGIKASATLIQLASPPLHLSAGLGIGATQEP